MVIFKVYKKINNEKDRVEKTKNDLSYCNKFFSNNVSDLSYQNNFLLKDRLNYKKKDEI